MSTLADRLHDLADERAPHDLDGGDLWQRGRRRHRRRRAGALVLVVAAVAVVAGGVGVGTRVVDGSQRDVAPAASDAPLPLLDRIELPSRWTGGTGDDGPIGPLAAVVGAERSRLWDTTEIGLAGVSAAGAYRFLDLPGYSGTTTTGVALAPDGRHLAYGYDGPTTGAPGGLDGEGRAGIAVYDTVTGDVRRHDVGAPHGISVEALAWSDDDTLLVNYVVFDAPEPDDGDGGSSASGTLPPTLVWVMDEPAPRPVASGRVLELSGVTPAGGRLLAATDRRISFTTTDGVTTTGPALPVAAEGGRVALSPDGTRIAWVEDPSPASFDGKARTVLVAELADPTGTVRRLDQTANVVVGWRDDGHVLTSAYDGSWTSVPVGAGATGATEVVVSVPNQQFGPGLLVADDALGGDPLDAPGPDRVLDRRVPLLAAAGGALGLLLLVGILVRGRRRARLR